MSLKDRAAEMARPAEQHSPAPTEAPPASVATTAPELELPDPGIPEPPEGGPEQVPVHIAWSRVMATVGSVGKRDSVKEGPARFDYRGVDRALNVFGPACRLHGVLVLPVDVQASYRDTKTSTGKPTRECTVVVRYRIVGPAGDHIEVAAAGESLDTGDKGTAKAQAVALRTFLYHGGLVPTGDQDPDSHNLERGEARIRSAASYRDEVLDPGTSRQRMVQIHHELRQHGLVGALVGNEHGVEEPIGELVIRTGKERFQRQAAPVTDPDADPDAEAAAQADEERGGPLRYSDREIREGS